MVFIIGLSEDKIELTKKKKSSCEGLIKKLILIKLKLEISKFLFQNENINFKILYQATRDDAQIIDIVNKIKGYNLTILLFYTKNGIKCGEYTKSFGIVIQNIKMILLLFFLILIIKQFLQ